ncbi:MAG TPA: hypothetical protein VK808_00395, partial [Bacteroidia bacterium]|nr:hypothetical protein [Bacteroidia bacterium]
MRKLLCISLLVLSFSFAEGQMWLWAKAATNLNINSTSDPLSVTTDSSGNIYETGDFLGSVLFGTDTINSGIPNGTPYLVKYGRSGSVIWAKSGKLLTNISEAYSFSVATDLPGNSIITGWFTGSVTFSSISLTNTGRYQISFMIAKYDTGGNILWAQSARVPNITNRSIGYSVATDAEGNIYCTGSFTGDTLIFGIDTVYGSFFLIKYNPSGNLIWVKGANVPRLATDENSAATIDNSGAIYITGNFGDTAHFGSYILNNHSTSNMFLVKYDSSGNVIWANCAAPFGKTGSATGAALTTDNSNNTYVTGQFNDTVSFGHYTFNKNKKGNIFIEKFEPNGNLINIITTSSSGTSVDESYSIVSNKWNGIYLCGNFSDTIQFGTLKLKAPASSSSFIIKFDTSLTALCGTVINDDNDDTRDGSYITTDPLADDVYLSGDGFGTNDSIVFGTTTLTGTYEFAFLAKWQPCYIATSIPPVIAKDKNTNVFPNPNTGIFTISLVGAQNFVPTIEVYNVMGQKVNFATLKQVQGDYEI